MEKIITNPGFSKDKLAQEFLAFVEAESEGLHLQESLLYYDFPVFQDYEDTIHRPTIMILSPEHGLLAFQLINMAGVSDCTDEVHRNDEELSEFYSLLFSRLIKSKLVRSSRTTIGIPFKAFLVAFGARDELSALDSENDTITSLDSLRRSIGEAEITRIEEKILNEVRSIIEGAKALTRPRSRTFQKDAVSSKAKILYDLEQEIANFDVNQRKIALTLIDGPQRIRGLAGSGKTIVLAMKVAYLHLNFPEMRILYTFYTRSLYDFIKRLVTRFYRHYKDVDPDWGKVHILHAWGGRTINGVYYSACIDNDIMPLTLKDVPKGKSDTFGYVCEELLKRTNINQKYDYILIDEAQDFPNHFFRLCFELAHGDNRDRPIIWAYDDLQNIFNVKRRMTSEMFGTEDGEPLIDLERAARKLPANISNDVVLYKCYRNPLEILICAHALGFGIYSDTIVQMLENQEHWEDVGYKVLDGDFSVGSKVIVERPRENSPLSFSGEKGIVEYFCADDISSEVEWVISQIAHFLDEGLEPQDIMVISLDDRNSRSYFNRISYELASKGMEVNDILANPFTSNVFTIDGKITLTTVHRAKGNEAAAIIAIGIDAIFPDRKNRIGRNRIFTAFTRSKAWLRVSGIGDGAKAFFEEIEKALNLSPRMEFVFPDPMKVEMHQRDLSTRASKLRSIEEKYRRELSRLGISEEEISEFFTQSTQGEKK